MADTVHTMTSLVGFEALLRELTVKTYGLPFYAGWGLTQDSAQCARRTRSLTLEELVYGCLELYPRYYSSDKGCFLSSREAISELAAARDASGRGTAGASPTRQLRRLKRYLWGLLSRA
jgi:capsular polysaccharide export protein